MFSYTTLSSEHAIIRFGFESADMSVWATSYGHKNWTSDKEYRDGGIGHNVRILSSVDI